MTTQAEQITALAQRIGQECKTIHTNMGSLDSLTTEQKTSLVAAINELKGAISTLQTDLGTLKTSLGTIDTDYVAIFKAALESA